MAQGPALCGCLHSAPQKQQLPPPGCIAAGAPLLHVPIISGHASYAQALQTWVLDFRWQGSLCPSHELCA